MDSGDDDQRDERVPGVVRLVTTWPIEIPAARETWTSAARRVQRRPWLLAVAAAALLAVLLTRGRPASP